VLLIFGANGGVGKAVFKNAAPDPGRNARWHGVQRVTRDLCELESEASVENFFDRLGDIDTAPAAPLYVLNATGVCVNGIARKYADDDLRKMVASNLEGSFRLAKHFHRVTKSRPGSSLLLLSSVVATTGVAGASSYGMVKAGITGLVRSLSKEYALHKLRVNCLELGYFDMGMISKVPVDLSICLKAEIPLGRWGTEEELYEAVEFCLRCGYLTGSTVRVNGGLA